MNNFLDIIAQSEIMHGISDREIKLVLECLNANTVCYPKGSVLYSEGDKVFFLGIVLSGVLSVSKTDFYGNKNIIMMIEKSGVFAETVAFSTDKLLPFYVEAETDCQVLLINTPTLTKTCQNNCIYHRQLIDNVVSIIANKNIQLIKKINILSARTTKEKVLELLNMYRKRFNSNTITLNMSRQEMADFLSVDRSALSRELGLLKKSRTIDYHKNVFKLL